MISTILQILAAIAGIVAAWFIGREGRKWLQRYQNAQDSDSIEDTRKAISEDNKQANDEKDKLDAIEDQFASGEPK